MLLDFIAQSDLRLPKNIRQKLLSTGNISDVQSSSGATTGGTKQATSSSSMSKQTTNRASRISGDRGYAEEVDVEVYPAFSNYHYMDDQQGTSQRIQRLLHDEAAQQQRNSAVPGEVFSRLSSNTPASVAGSNRNHVTGDALMSDTRNVAASWARSSRSSGRYSESAADDDEEDMIGHHDYENQSSGKGANIVTVNSPKPPTSASYNTRGDGTPKSRVMSSTTSWTASVDQKPSAGEQQSSSTKAATSTPPVASNERVEEVRPDGSRVIKYRNGTIKEVHPSGKSLVIFTNGDSKHSDPATGVVVYFYAQANTTHTTYKDGTEVYEFPNGQVSLVYLFFSSVINISFTG